MEVGMQSTEELERMAAVIAAELERRRLRRSCEWCGTSFTPRSAKGRFCSPRCRVTAHRNPLPVELTKRDRWVRFNPDKTPVTVAGYAASSTNAATWAPYSVARRSSFGVGLGFVLNGDGITCIDLDGVVNDKGIDPRAVDFITASDPFYVEASPSGRGLHAWTWAQPPSSRRRWTLENGLAVEWYTDKRYLTVTGKRANLT